MEVNQLLSIIQNKRTFFGLLLLKTIKIIFFYLVICLILLLFWDRYLMLQNPFLYLAVTLVFLGLLAWQLWLFMTGWFWKLELTSDKIILQKFTEKSITLANEDLQKYENKKNNRIILGTNEIQIKLNLHSLPIKEKIILLHSLLNWAPIHVLKPSVKNMLEQRNIKSGEVLSLQKVAFEAHRHPKRQWRTRLLPILAAIGYVSLFVWLGVNGSFVLRFDFGSAVALLVIAAMPAILLLLAWVATSNASIRVDNTGIHWNYRSKMVIFPWKDISAISLSPFGRVGIHIWQEDSKSQNIVLTSFHREDVIEFMIVLHGQAFARDIPTIIN